MWLHGRSCLQSRSRHKMTSCVISLPPHTTVDGTVFDLIFEGTKTWLSSGRGFPSWHVSRSHSRDPGDPDLLRLQLFAQVLRSMDSLRRLAFSCLVTALHIGQQRCRKCFLKIKTRIPVVLKTKKCRGMVGQLEDWQRGDYTLKTFSVHTMELYASYTFILHPLING